MNPAEYRRSSFRRFFFGFAVSCSLCVLVGCAPGGSSGGTGSGGTSGTGSTPDPAHIFATGNWQFQAATTGGAAPFSTLSGFINEQGTNPGVDDLTTAAFQPQAAPCYIGTTTIPMQGSVGKNTITIQSFLVTGQLLNISATEDATVTHMTGNYTIAGGCADKAAGTLTGTKYSALTGTYSGSVTGTTPAQTIQLSLAQFTQGTGSGNFLVSGAGAFTGFSCFTKGTLSSTNGSVVGSSVSLTLDTDDAKGAQVVLVGSINPAADTLTISSGTITAGSCAGTFGGATLALQK